MNLGQYEHIYGVLCEIRDLLQKFTEPPIFAEAKEIDWDTLRKTVNQSSVLISGKTGACIERLTPAVHSNGDPDAKPMMELNNIGQLPTRKGEPPTPPTMQRGRGRPKKAS